MTDVKKTEAAHRAAVEAHCAATATPAGGSYIKHADGTMSLDPNGVTTQPAAPAGDTAAAPVAAPVAVAETADLSAQKTDRPAKR